MTLNKSTSEIVKEFISNKNNEWHWIFIISNYVDNEPNKSWSEMSNAIAGKLKEIPDNLILYVCTLAR